MKLNLLHLEVTAENLDTAVENALSQLKCTRAEADVEVLQAASPGFLGLFGKRQARVRVKLHDRGAIARQFTDGLLRLSGLSVEIEVLTSTKQIQLLLSSDDSSLLIGRHGQMLDAMQSLVGTMTDRQTTDRTPIVLDVDGYRARRHEFLTRLADKLSCKVRETRKPATTPPLTLGERRILYERFKQEVDLEAISRNHEGDRKVMVLKPREK
ncbi:MAG: Jag N-terminal domain-containing protein [Desulfuromonadales bacterium]|jgi:spoIIIJ-associated protein|nr:Jag N-terminal domain-containing protein [Desulfuromonadales bacterium]